MRAIYGRQYGQANHRPRGLVLRGLALRALAVGAVAGLVACASDSPLAPGTAQLDLVSGFWHLTANHQAVTLSTVAPYDTIRLVVTPRNAAGAPLTGAVLDSVVTTYTLQDPRDTSVTITADGLVRARYAHDGSGILVRTRVRGLTRADTIPVNVTDTATPPHAAALGLSVAPDTLTATFGGDLNAAVTARVLDDATEEIPHAAVRILADPTHLTLSMPVGGTTGLLTPKSFAVPGRTWLVAEATVYGVTVRDSVPVTLTPPAFFTLTAVFGTPKAVGHPVGHFEPAVDTLTIATPVDPLQEMGALVVFVNPTATPIDVVWDDPAAVHGSLYTQFLCHVPGAGNIPAFVRPTAGSCPLDGLGQMRLLPTPGTYHYHSALYGTQGTIVVVPR